MFWNNHTSSATMDVLSRTDLTLGELLNQENILDELKAQNSKLIEFITRQEIMEDLIRLIVEEPSQDLDERERYRKSNLACEVLTTDLPVLNEKLSENTLLSQLFKFLEGDAPLNPLLASFFSRTMSVLICRKSDQHWYSYQYTCLHVIEFFKSKENSLGLLLKHIGTSAIMDLALKLITQIEGCNIRSIIVNWFESEGLINNVISLFEPSIDSDRHYNAAQLLCDTMEKSRETILSNQKALKASSADDSILSAIQSPDTVQKLLSYMLDGELSESSIISGISVLLALIDFQAQDYYHSCESNISDENCGDSPPPINPVYRSIVAAIVPYLPKFCNLLLNPPHKNGVKLAYGLADPPLGNTRLNIIKLIASLIETRWPLPEVHDALIELDTFNILLDLFFKYTWNNFLHSQIYKCLKSVFEVSLIVEVDKLLPHIFVNCRLLERILNAWDENEEEQLCGKKRRGYMGHLILISTLIDGLFQRKESVKKYIEEYFLDAWKGFILDKISPVIKTQARCLGGIHPGLSHDEDSDGNDYTDIDFGNVVPSSDQHSEDQPATTFILEQAFLKTLSAPSWEECCNKQEYWKGGKNTDVFTNLPMSYWNNTEDPGSGSSDEEEKTGTDSKESDEGWAKSRGYFRTNIWTKGECQPTDIENPWGSEPLKAEELENEKWADFESYFSKFESSLSFEEPTTSGRVWENKPDGDVKEPVGVENTQENNPLEPEVLIEEMKPKGEAAPVEMKDSVPPAEAAPVEIKDSVPPPEAAPVEMKDSARPAEAAPVEMKDSVPPPEAAPVEMKDSVPPAEAAPFEIKGSVPPAETATVEIKDSVPPAEAAPVEIKDSEPTTEVTPVEMKEGVLPAEVAPVEIKENVSTVDGDSQAVPVPEEPPTTQSADTLPQIESTNVVVSETERKEETPVEASVAEPEGSGGTAGSEETPQNSSETQDDDGGGSA